MIFSVAMCKFFSLLWLFEVSQLLFSFKTSTKIPVFWKNGAKTKDKIALNLIKIFNEGPLVSFNGSPTVSPITAALWTSVCFPRTNPYSLIYLPLSMYFLALSQAPPVFEADMAS